MTKKAHFLHVLAVVGTTALSVLAEALTTGQLSHAAWAVPALFLVNYLRKLTGTTPPPATLVMLVALTAISSCKTITGPVPPPGTPGLANCSDATMHDAELRLLPSLENAVALANFADVEGAVAQIVATEAISVGGPLALAEASCVIAWIESKAEAVAGVTADSLEARKAANAKTWLAKDGTPVSNVPQ
jgi:hypothetical protein